MITEIVSELETLINSWGGKLILEADSKHLKRGPLWAPCPFSYRYSICWKSKEISMLTPTTALEIVGLFHEIGHVFACLTDPTVDLCEEITFFAWEWKLAQRFGMDETFRRGNKEYGISGVFTDHLEQDFGHLSHDEQTEFLTRLYKETLDRRPRLFVGDTPTSIRCVS